MSVVGNKPVSNVVDFFKEIEKKRRKRKIAYYKMINSVKKPTARNLRKVLDWVTRNITYRSTTEVQSPKSTISRGFGDSDDLAVFMADSFVKVGVKPAEVFIVTGRLSAPSCSEPFGHTLVAHKGLFYCPIHGVKSRLREFEEIGRISYQELFLEAS